MRNTAKVQAVALAAMIAVALVAGAGEAQAARRASGAMARRAEAASNVYTRTVDRPRYAELAGRSLRTLFDGWCQTADFAKARLAAAARIR